MVSIDSNGLLDAAKYIASPNYNDRPENEEINLLVIHNISLPPSKFGTSYIEDFFLNKLDASKHPYFETIKHIKVSAHLLIKRDGQMIQFVSFDKRAWHAGISSYCGRQNCNDFSIGIELEGTDEISFTDVQYQQLLSVTECLLKKYPNITVDRIVGHSDISPLRKTDPGPAFNWDYYRQGIQRLL